MRRVLPVLTLVLLAAACRCAAALTVTVGAGIASAHDWTGVAQCESGGDWHIDTGNGFYGGLQFHLDTWRDYGGVGNPAHASRAEQVRVAERVLAGQGIGAWPVCGKHLRDGTDPSQLLPGGLGSLDSAGSSAGSAGPLGLAGSLDPAGALDPEGSLDPGGSLDPTGAPGPAGSAELLATAGRLVTRAQQLGALAAGVHGALTGLSGS